MKMDDLVIPHFRKPPYGFPRFQGLPRRCPRSPLAPAPGACRARRARRARAPGGGMIVIYHDIPNPFPLILNTTLETMVQ